MSFEVPSAGVVVEMSALFRVLLGTWTHLLPHSPIPFLSTLGFIRHGISHVYRIYSVAVA